MANKLECLPTEAICQLCLGTFSEAEIESSKKQLYGLCAEDITSRIIIRKGPKKNAQNMEDIVKTMHQCGTDIPTFVALNLQALPPVSFNSLDVSTLLHSIKKTQVEVDLMKKGMIAQDQTIKDLQSVVSQQAKCLPKCHGEMTCTGESAAPALLQAGKVDLGKDKVGDDDGTPPITVQADGHQVNAPQNAVELDAGGSRDKVREGDGKTSAAVTNDGQQKDEQKVTAEPQAGGSYAAKVANWNTMRMVNGKLKAVPVVAVKDVSQARVELPFQRWGV